MSIYIEPYRNVTRLVGLVYCVHNMKIETTFCSETAVDAYQPTECNVSVKYGVQNVMAVDGVGLFSLT